MVGRRACALVLAAVFAVVAAACESSDDATDTGPAATPDALGTPRAATGTPVKLGFVSEGKASFVDNSVEGASARATVKWLNEYRNGIAGHRIELVECDTEGIQAKATDCASTFVREGVVAVVFNELAVAEELWSVLHTAGIPTMTTAMQGDPPRDPETSFILTDLVAAGVQVPLAVAKEAKTEKASVVVIDVPGAADTYRQLGTALFRDAGIELTIIPIAPGTPDMTAQLAPLAKNGTGMVDVLGDPTFCIAAFNALAQTGYTGRIVTLNPCMSDATREQVDGQTLEHIVMAAPAAIGVDDPSMRTFYAVIAKYAPTIPHDDPMAVNVFQLVSALQDASTGVDANDVSPSTLIAAIKAMPEKELQAAAGMRYRCNGKAVPESPAICTRGALVTTLNDRGEPASYSVVGSSPIPG